VTGRPDGLTNLEGPRGLHANWRAMLRPGLEAGDLPAEPAAAIDAHTRSGRPLGSEGFVAALEAATGRHLKRRKPGPRPRSR